jgi:hypothetical protein
MIFLGTSLIIPLVIGNYLSFLPAPAAGIFSALSNKKAHLPIDFVGKCASFGSLFVCFL